MCGGSPKIPEAPDYSKQKSAFAEAQNQNYATQAARYNTAANAFNSNLSNIGREVSTIKSSLGSLNIGDKTGIDNAFKSLSDLRTRANSEFSVDVPGLSSFSSTTTPPTLNNAWATSALVSGLGGSAFGIKPPGPTTNFTQQQGGNETLRFNGLTGFNLERPNFQSIVTTPYAGETVSLNIPNLVNPNIDLGRQYLSDIDSGLATLEGLRRQREAEAARVGQFRTTYESQLADLRARASQLSVGDTAGRAAIDAEINRLDAQRRGFSTPLASEFQDFFGGTPSSQSGISQALSDFDTRTQTEQARVDAFRNNFFRTLDEARTGLTGLGTDRIEDIRGIDTRIDQLAREARRFSSALNPDFSTAFDEYNELNNSVDQLYARAEQEAAQRQREAERAAAEAKAKQEAEAAAAAAEAAKQAELGRITTARTGFANRLTEFQNRINGLTIADLDAIRAADADLSAFDRTFSGFSSNQEFDFNDLYDQYGRLDSRLSQLYQDRAAEEARVQGALSQGSSFAQTLARQAGMLDPADYANQRALAADLARARADRQRFSSALNPDMSGIDADLTAAEQALKAAQDRRAADLTGFSSRYGELANSIGSLALEDDTNLSLRRSQVNRALSELAAYGNGEDAAAIRRSFSGLLDTADTRTAELSNKRNDIETRARSFLSGLSGRAFFGDEDLNASLEEARTLQTEAGRFRASQSDDELAAIMSKFDAERGRFQQDRRAVEARDLSDRQSAQQMLRQNEIMNFFRARRAQPVTANEYDQLNTLARQTASPFSLALMAA
jgi:hypothetical protein